MRVHCLCRYCKAEAKSWNNPKIIEVFSTYPKLQEHVKAEYPEFTWNERSQNWEHPDTKDVLYTYSDVIMTHI